MLTVVCPLALVAFGIGSAGCVSSTTWTAWHRTRDRLEALDEEASEVLAASDAGGEEPAHFVFATCDDAAREAAIRNPGLVAPRERARAALAMARAEGALPAPRVRVAVWDFPIGDPSLGDHEGMYMLSLAQELPPPGALDASARASVEEARAALGALDERRRVITNEAGHACVDWAGAEATAARLSAWVALLGEMRAVVDARLASGAGGTVADAARLEREIATGERMLTRATGDAERARETLRAALGVGAEADLGAAPPLPSAVPEPSAAAVLARAIERRGLLEALRASVAAAEARARAAEERAAVPMFMFGGMYMQRPQARAGMSLEISMTLPWLWSGEGDRAEAARASAAAAEAEVEGATRAIEVAVHGSLAELRTRGRVLDTLVSREAPAAALALDASAGTYASGLGTLLDWLDAARAIRELEIEEAALRAAVLHAEVSAASAMGGTIADLESGELAGHDADDGVADRP